MKLKYLVCTFLLLSCSDPQMSREKTISYLKDFKITEIKCQNESLEEVVSRLDRALNEESGIKIYVELLRYDGPNERNIESSNENYTDHTTGRIDLDLEDVPARFACEVIALLSNSYYYIAPQKLTFYAPSKDPHVHSMKMITETAKEQTKQ